MSKIVAGGILILAGIGGYTVYKKYHVKANVSVEDDFNAANSLFGEYVPFLPIHSKSNPQTRGIYTTLKPSTRYKDGIVPARNTDYYNPSQLVASTGPGNLAPFATGDSRMLKKESLQ